jgi:hypothetical protein
MRKKNIGLFRPVLGKYLSPLQQWWAVLNFWYPEPAGKGRVQVCPSLMVLGIDLVWTLFKGGGRFSFYYKKY